MTQALIERFSDWIFPLVAGVFIWFAIHYFAITPRIINSELPIEYQHYHLDQNLSYKAGTCMRNNISGAVLSFARMESAIYTASLRHINLPFQEKKLAAEISLDKKCGISEERQAQREIKLKELERQKQFQELARKDALVKKKLELEAKAQEQYQKQIKQQFQFFMELLTGEE